jgi:methionyl-tRNA formyltransferase
MALRIVFMGTPAFSVPVLEAVLQAGHSVAAVYSQPPRPAGRGMAGTKSPVHLAAEAHGIAVRTPLNFKNAADCEAFAALKADAAVVVAYGLLLPEAILNATRLGCFNVHASKLPRWRGAAPIQRAIMADDRVTAVNVMRMEKGLDTGPVCLGRDVAIAPGMTAGALHDALSFAGAEIMIDALARLERGELTEIPQPESGITYAAKIDKRETRIDFNRPATDVVNHIHGLSPVPGAWFEISGAKPERVKVLSAALIAGSGSPGTVLDGPLVIACAEGAVQFSQVQRAGKKPVTAQEFLRGFKFDPGTRLA